MATPDTTDVTEQPTQLKLVTAEDKKSLRDRLVRIEGQLRGVQKMIDREADCEEVAQQLAAAQNAMKRAFSDMIARTVEHNCVQPDERDDPEAREKLKRLVQIMTKYG
ncbi:MAG: metal-sensing transcriptional repressor [Candidatus Bipolaricaulia bacterium]